MRILTHIYMYIKVFPEKAKTTGMISENALTYSSGTFSI